MSTKARWILYVSLAAVIHVSSEGAIIRLENATDGSMEMTLAPGEAGVMNIVLEVSLFDTLTVAQVEAYLDDDSDCVDVMSADCLEIPGSFCDRFFVFPAEISEDNANEYGLFWGVFTPSAVLGPGTYVLDSLTLSHTGPEIEDEVLVTFELGSRAPDVTDFFGAPLVLASPGMDANVPNFLYVGDANSTNPPFIIHKVLDSDAPPSVGLPCTGTGSAQDCCAEGQTIIEGTNRPDAVKPPGEAAWCILGYSSDDVLSGDVLNDTIIGDTGNDELRGGAGNDTLIGSAGNDRLRDPVGNNAFYGGLGNDWISGGANDHIEGGAGDDMIFAYGGNDFIVGGAGLDKIEAGEGDDTIVIYDVCEIVSGEVIDGGSGNDTVITPVPEATLSAMGVNLVSIENYQIDATNSALSGCGICGCQIDGSDDGMSCCNNTGQCNANEYGGWCECDPGYFGVACESDAQVFHSDDPDCEPGDPECDDDPGNSSTEDEVCVEDSQSAEPFVCPISVGSPPDDIDTQAEWIVYHPSDADGPPDLDCDEDWQPEKKYPIVVLVHGQGHQYEWYNYLLEHLAKNGFIAVSLEVDILDGAEDSMLRRDILDDFLSCILTNSDGNPFFPHWNGKVGLIGHSRGGEAVFLMAKDNTHPIDAVLSLAPGRLHEEILNENNSNFQDVDPVLGIDQVDGYMVIVGTRDSDVGMKGVAYYDKTGHESSVGADPDVNKIGVIVRRARHNGFLQEGAYVPEVSTNPLQDATHRAILKGYANGFFQWILNGESKFKPYFSGEASMKSIVDTANAQGDSDLLIFPEFSEGLNARRRVVDHFSDNNEFLWQSSTIWPDEVSVFESNMNNVDENWLEEITVLDGITPLLHHEGRGLDLSWNTDPSNFGTVTFAIPDTVDEVVGYGDEALTPGGKNNDVRWFSHLSFRVGHIWGDKLNGDSEPAVPGPDDFENLDFGVCLGDALDSLTCWPMHELALFTPPPPIGLPNPQIGNIPYPDIDGSWVQVQTVRIPLQLYCAVNQLEQVNYVVFRFNHDVDNVDGALVFRGRMWIDNIEFVVGEGDDPAVYSCFGVCGNGQVEGSEECDDGNLVADDGCTNCTTDGDGGGGGPPDDCDYDGCPGYPCLEVPFNEGAAAYYQDGRYCNDSNYVCRPDEDSSIGWSCLDCTDPDYDGSACPCSPGGPECPANYQCIGYAAEGSDPHTYPISPTDGACWPDGAYPDGFCEESCEGQARVCSSTLDIGPEDICITPECAGNGPDACELQLPEEVCQRLDDDTCGPPCISDAECASEFGPGTICTDWGECWPS